MNWQAWFYLLDKYKGDLQCATSLEIERAKKASGEQWIEARHLALKKYEDIYGSKH